MLNLAAEKAGWGTPLPAGRARGIAVHESFGSFVAQVAEVSVEDGRIRVHRVVCAIDCGIAVNPATIAAQMESGIAFGLGAALRERDHLQGRARAAVELPRLPRAAAAGDAARSRCTSCRAREKPGGVGEPGTPPIAPAVANAVAALTGQRLRELPLKLRA